MSWIQSLIVFFLSKWIKDLETESKYVEYDDGLKTSVTWDWSAEKNGSELCHHKIIDYFNQYQKRHFYFAGRIDDITQRDGSACRRHQSTPANSKLNEYI